MANRFGIPYISQWDPEASHRASDCGLACAAMLLRWRSVQVRVNDLPSKDGSGLSNVVDQARLLNAHGVRAWAIYPEVMTLEQLPLPAIVSVNYSQLSSRQDVYRGFHSLIVTGTHDAWVETVDPDFWGGRRNEGDGKRYGRTEFERAWSIWGRHFAVTLGPGSRALEPIHAPEKFPEPEPRVIENRAECNQLGAPSAAALADALAFDCFIAADDDHIVQGCKFADERVMMTCIAGNYTGMMLVCPSMEAAEESLKQFIDAEKLRIAYGMVSIKAEELERG